MYAIRSYYALAIAYYMKEDLRQLWNWKGDKIAARWHLTSWIGMARSSGIGMLEKFANTLEQHCEGILAYFDFDSLSTGCLEGTNNKIKTMQRQAYGFRDIEFFKLKIKAFRITSYNVCYTKLLRDAKFPRLSAIAT